MSLTRSSGSRWVRLSPEATEMTARGEADSSLVEIQALLWLRRPRRARLGNSGHLSGCAKYLFSPGLSNSFDLKGANTWTNHRVE